MKRQATKLFGTWLGVLLSGTFFSAGAHGQLAMAQEGKGITVRVLLYSGKPDPSYVLEEGVLTSEIKAMIARAEVVSVPAGESVIPAILGYKGIVVQNPGRAAGLPSRISVYKERMEVIDETKRTLVDRSGALEKTLLDEAIRRGLIEKSIVERMKK
jgi:hypothetical protein